MLGGCLGGCLFNCVTWYFVTWYWGVGNIGEGVVLGGGER